MGETKGVIYILTNPSFPDYVKIGYADDINVRLKQLNRSECIPFAFRIYATYEVDSRLSDIKVHSIIDKLNPDLRSIDTFNGQKRKKEFYAMSPEDAYEILEAIADINGMTDRLKRYNMSDAEANDKKMAEDVEKNNSGKAANFTFSMCGIKAGEIIEYCNDPSITATVVDEKHVEYAGQTMTLTALAKILLGAKYSVAGPRFFKYKGEWLNDLRNKNGY